MITYPLMVFMVLAVLQTIAGITVEQHPVFGDNTGIQYDYYVPVALKPDSLHLVPMISGPIGQELKLVNNCVLSDEHTQSRTIQSDHGPHQCTTEYVLYKFGVKDVETLYNIYQKMNSQFPNGFQLWRQLGNRPEFACSTYNSCDWGHYTIGYYNDDLVGYVVKKNNIDLSSDEQWRCLIQCGDVSIGSDNRINPGIPSQDNNVVMGYKVEKVEISSEIYIMNNERMYEITDGGQLDYAINTYFLLFTNPTQFNFEQMQANFCTSEDTALVTDRWRFCAREKTKFKIQVRGTNVAICSLLGCNDAKIAEGFVSDGVDWEYEYFPKNNCRLSVSITRLSNLASEYVISFLDEQGNTLQDPVTLALE